MCVGLGVSKFLFETLTPETLAARTPAFGTPAFGTPAFGTPAFGTPAFGTPAFGTWWYWVIIEQNWLIHDGTGSEEGSTG